MTSLPLPVSAPKKPLVRLRRPRHGEARREVVLVPLVVAGLVVGRTRRDRSAPSGASLVDRPASISARRCSNQSPRRDVRRDLQAVDLPRRREEAVAQSGGDGEVRPDLPAVLRVESRTRRSRSAGRRARRAAARCRRGRSCSTRPLRRSRPAAESTCRRRSRRPPGHRRAARRTPPPSAPGRSRRACRSCRRHPPTSRWPAGCGTSSSCS